MRHSLEQIPKRQEKRYENLFQKLKLHVRDNLKKLSVIINHRVAEAMFRARKKRN